MTTKQLRATGIGDLHLDGHYAADIPDYNARICACALDIVRGQVERGITLVFFYGDLAHRRYLSEDAQRCLVQLFQDITELGCRSFVIKGNHEDRAPGESALDHLVWLTSLLPAEKCDVTYVLYEPKTYKLEGQKVRFLPYPHVDTRADCLNVMHADAEGSKRDNGHPVAEGFKPHHLSVVGHNHTAQIVGNAHYSGTLYTTRAGEAPEKFYHDIRWTGDITTSEITLVPAPSPILIEDHTISNDDQYHAFCAYMRQDDGVARLARVYVHDSEVDLPDGAFDNVPGLLKVLQYTTKKELRALRRDAALEEELDDETNTPALNVKSSMSDWLRRKNVDAHVHDGTITLLNDLTGIPDDKDDTPTD